MFLHLGHTKLAIYTISKQFVFECYKLTKLFPADEKFAMTSQIRRAALSVHLNIAEGSSRTSVAERKRYYEISRGSVIEIDAALDIAFELNYCNQYDLEMIGSKMIDCFKCLSGLIKANENKKTSW